ncbi:MAG: S1 RNA-binding domain-containing protein [Oscillospiraceae bacterium]|nr:S1 RNA-binding domain-containing protein [Oscillospiraceae bacterium]
MDLRVGALLEGKVKTIARFGAFVELPDGSVGMVHVSEISYSYVDDIHALLKEGQTVKVKVLSLDEKGKIALSIKRTHEQARRPGSSPCISPKAGPQSFEEKLKQFMSDSDSKISGCRQYEHRTRSRKR